MQKRVLVLTNLVYWDKLILVYRNKPRRHVMKDIELGTVQERFADIVWANEPLGSGELVKLCEKELGWKKPTTYTVLRKLCEKGLLKNEDGVVTTLISREDFYSAKSEQIIEDSYEGSLPAFIAAFTSRKKLSNAEVNEIQKMIDEFKKGEKK
jgi:predicted transcriptional regulator